MCVNFEDYESEFLYVCPGFPKTLGWRTPSGRHARADVLKSRGWWTPSGQHGRADVLKSPGRGTPSGRHARADVLKSPGWWTPSGRQAHADDLKCLGWWTPSRRRAHAGVHQVLQVFVYQATWTCAQGFLRPRAGELLLWLYVGCPSIPHLKPLYKPLEIENSRG